MQYQKYMIPLAKCCKDIFEEMTSTTVEHVEIKIDDRNAPAYKLAQVISYSHTEDHISGDFLLGFESKLMAIMVASAISESIGLGVIRDFGEEAHDAIGEYMNTVVGRALTEWDALGLPAIFGVPHGVEDEEVQMYSSSHTTAFMIILTLSVSEITFHVSFTKNEPDPLDGKRVLVVDDSRIIRKLLRKSLEEVGLEVHEATNGREAVEMFETVSPDLTIMDIVMPEMTGLEATKLIREKNPAANVLMLTSTSRRDEIITARDSGAINYLLKPVKMPLLIEALREALG